MVHRQADSRLLTNLLAHEKDYVKQLNALLDVSNASLASFAAYAAASPPSVSHVILSVAGSLAATDEALRRYAHGVDEWREAMRQLKDLEDEVGNMMRDREILVTRLIKASNKSQKSSPGNFRDSLLFNSPHRQSSASTISLHDSSSPSRPLSSFASSSKLAAAQSELQACEVHLAAKERELALKRCAAVQDGLGARVRALIECGWAWNELGKEGLTTIQNMHMSNGSADPQSQRPPFSHESHIGELPSYPNNNNNSIPAKSLPMPEQLNTSARPSSDSSSIGPSQSASQVNLENINANAPPPINISSILSPETFAPLPPTPNNDNLDHTSNSPSSKQSGSAQSENSTTLPPNDANRPLSGFSLGTPATYTLETVKYAPAVALIVGGKGSGVTPTAQGDAATSREMYNPDVVATMRIPAAHRMSDYEIPTAEIVSGPTSRRGSLHEERERARSPLAGSIHSQGPTDRQSQPFSSSRSLQPPPAVPHQPFRGEGSSTPTPATQVGSPIKRRSVERRSDSFHEEEQRQMHRLSTNSVEFPVSSTQGVDFDAESISDEIEEEKKMVKAGKLAVVENPRFMSEQRKKELELEKQKELAKEAQRQTEPQSTTVEDPPSGTPKEKKRFSLFHGHHKSSSGSQVNSSRVTPSDAGHGPPAAVLSSPPPPMQRAVAIEPDPHTRTPANSTPNTSPSKTFLGTLKVLFAPNKSPSLVGPTASAGAGDGTRRPSQLTRQLSASSSDDEHVNNADASDSDDYLSPSKRRTEIKSSKNKTKGGFAAFFRGKPKQPSTSQWETRTDRNIAELREERSERPVKIGKPGPLSERRESFDDGSLSRRPKVAVRGSGWSPGTVGLGMPAVPLGGAQGVTRGGSVLSIASATAVGEGAPGTKSRGRSASDIGYAGVAGQASPVKGGRRLKKAPRKVSHSDVGVVTPPSIQPPIPGPSMATPPPRNMSSPTITPPAKQSHRRSASVDAGVERRKSRILEQQQQQLDELLERENKGKQRAREEEGSGEDVIIDLGWNQESSSSTGPGRRRANSEIGLSTTGTSGNLVLPKAPPPVTSSIAPQISSSKPTSTAAPSQTFRMTAPAPPGPTPPPGRQKSLVKKKIQPSTATTTSANTSTNMVMTGALSGGSGTNATGGALLRRSSTTTSRTSSKSKSPKIGANSGASASASTVVLNTGPGAEPSGVLVFNNPPWRPSASVPDLSQTRTSQKQGWGWWPEQSVGVGGGLAVGRQSSFSTGGGDSRTVTGSGAGAGRTKKRQGQAQLGQGMSGSGTAGMGIVSGASPVRKASLKSTAASSGPPTQAPLSTSPVLQATPAVPSLMSIVEDVAKQNREGWKPPSKAIPVSTLSEVPRAPRSVKRDELMTLDAVGVKNRIGAGTVGVALGDSSHLANSVSATGGPRMLEVRAPGSVFDQMKTSTPPQPPLQRYPQQQQQLPQQHSPPRNQTSLMRKVSESTRPAKSPLRSALRQPSRTPSPLVHTDAPTYSGAAPPLPGRFNGSQSMNFGDTLSSSTGKPRKQLSVKGKGRAKAPTSKSSEEERVQESTTDDSYATGQEFYTDEGESGPEAPPAVAQSPSAIPPVLGTDDGHAVRGQAQERTTSDESHSTVSTAVNATTAGSPPSASAASPRRRKSVRVSLKPTFSPSPPAIEYEDDEAAEVRQHGPWAWGMHPVQPQPFGQVQETQQSRYPAPLPHVPDIVAPTPVPSTASQPKILQRDRGDVDMWADSSDDEDEEYRRAKLLLSRAAKKEKDVNALAANAGGA